MKKPRKIRIAVVHTLANQWRWKIILKNNRGGGWSGEPNKSRRHVIAMMVELWPNRERFPFVTREPGKAYVPLADDPR